MEHWQQRAERGDPYEDIPFDEGRRWSPDTLVGLTCAVVAGVGLLVELAKRLG